MGKPGRWGPWVTLVVSLYISVSWFINIFVGNDGVLLSMVISLVGVAGFVTSCWWMNRRLKALDQWKENRELSWFINTDLDQED